MNIYIDFKSDPEKAYSQLHNIKSLSMKYKRCNIDCLSSGLPFLDIFGLAQEGAQGGGVLILENCLNIKQDIELYEGVIAALGFTVINDARLGIAFKRTQLLENKGLANIHLVSNFNRISQAIGLFTRVFGEKIPRDFWLWKYSRSFEKTLTFSRGMSLVGYYGCTKRDIVVGDENYSAYQSCDVMIDRSSRGGISSGLFSHMAHLYIAQFEGKGDILFGFPHGRQYKLAKRLKMYSGIDDVLTLVFDPSKNNVLSETLSSHLECTDEWISKSWGEMRANNEKIFLKKDLNYITYRYLSHPVYKYDLVALEISQRPVTLIFRDVGASVVHLMDFIGPIESYCTAINLACLYVAKHYPDKKLLCWKLKSNYLSLLEGCSFPYNVHEDGAMLVTANSSNVDFYSSDTCRWIVSMGDAEFL